MTSIESNTSAINPTGPPHQFNIFGHPSMADYYNNLTPFIILSIFVSTLLVILNCAIFCTTVKQIRQRLNKPLVNISIALCSPYPIISVAAISTILIPKAWLPCHTIMHLSFTVCALFFHRLCVEYMESESNFIKVTEGNPVEINTPPCCCCCVCLPKLIPSETKFSVIKYLVWQMPLVQGAIMLVLNGIYYTEPEFYGIVSKYFAPFIVCSILLGIWVLNIIVRMVMKLHPYYSMTKKMFCLQLILLLCKFQYWLLDKQLDALRLGGHYPMNHTIYKQTFINLLILAEMVLVSLLAQSAYKVPVHIVPK